MAERLRAPTCGLTCSSMHACTARCSTHAGMLASATPHMQSALLVTQAVWSVLGILHEADSSPAAHCTRTAVQGWRAAVNEYAPPQVWLHRAGLGRWVPVAKFGPQAAVACVHWACTVGRAVELVAVGAGEHVTVHSLQGPADALKARARTGPPLLTSITAVLARTSMVRAAGVSGFRAAGVSVMQQAKTPTTR